MSGPDPFAGRLRPARADLAAASLRGKVTAARFAEGKPHRVSAPLLDLRLAPEGGRATQLLHGDAFTVFERRPDGIAWGQAARDGYVGYVAETGLGPDAQTNARLTALHSHVYVRPDIKSATLRPLPAGAALRAGETQGAFVRLAAGGFVPAPHLAPAAGDFVDQARRFLGAPYLWGGCSAAGLDCSALVQLALLLVGVPAPRDSDMQEARLGRAKPRGAPPERGDLIFWKGHVGILSGPDTLLHANAHHMAVAEEPFAAAAARIAANAYGPVTSRRRPPPAALVSR